MSWKTHLLQLTNTFLHIYNRGVDRGTLFFRETDFEYFLFLLAQARQQVNVTLFAYALLPNHFHLLLRQNTAYSVCSFMQGVCHAYAVYLNRQRKRTGHLFEGRFRIGRILDNASLLRTSHYVHWNPVAAGLVKNPADWKYSSYKAYAESQRQSFLAVDELISLTGGQEAYLRFLLTYDPSHPGSVQEYLMSG